MEQQNTYTDLATDMAHYSRALGHPARIAILVEIAKRGFFIKGETPEIPSLSQATVLQHLRELKRAGLIQGRIFGARAEYKIDLSKLHLFGSRLEEFLEYFQKP